jgi:hypothetical protein
MGKGKSKFTDLEKYVEAQVLAWAFQNRWSLDVLDSKAVQSASGRYVRNSGVKVGTPDLVGCTDAGHAVYLELKKPGNASVCRLEQRQFLERKIDHNCFCLVVDNLETLQKVYLHFFSLTDLQERRTYLKALLPKKVLISEKILTLQES